MPPVDPLVIVEKKNFGKYTIQYVLSDDGNGGLAPFDAQNPLTGITLPQGYIDDQKAEGHFSNYIVRYKWTEANGWEVIVAAAKGGVTNTSQLVNDGDGLTPFAIESEVVAAEIGNDIQDGINGKKGGYLSISTKGSEIKQAIQVTPDTNFVNDAELQKLQTIEGSKYLGTYPNLPQLVLANPSPAPGSYGYVDGGVGVDTEKYIWDVDDNDFIKQAGDIAEETPVSVKTKYESNADTNAFTDTEKTKVGYFNDLGGFLKLSNSDDNLLPALVLEKSRSTVETGLKPYTLLLQNLSEIAGGNDHQNETVLGLKAGSTGNHRRYLAYVNYDDSIEGYSGINGSGAYIIYNATDLNHPLIANPASSGGNTELSASGNGGIWMNYHSSLGSHGTGGVRIFDGTVGSSQFAFFKDGSLALGYNSNLNTDYQLSFNAIIDPATFGTGSGSMGSTLYNNIISLSANTSRNLFNQNATLTLNRNGYDSNDMYSIQARCTINGSGNTPFQYAVLGQNIVNAGTVGTSYVFHASNTLSGAATGTSAYGLYITGFSNGFGYRAGIRVLDQSGGSNAHGIRLGLNSGTGKYNVYADGTAINYFNGNVGIKRTNPETELDINGSLTLRGGHIFKSQKATDGSASVNGEMWWGTDGALYFKGGSGTITLIAAA